MYLFRPTWIQKQIYSKCLWRVPEQEKSIYLTFDDGPSPEVTDFVLSELKRFSASATFFLLGKNMEACPDLVNQILADGHLIGNHTFSHVSGWNVTVDQYLKEVNLCAEIIDSSGLLPRYFRPPYGRISRRQMNTLASDYQIVMWSTLSGDFDPNLKVEQSWTNIKASKAGEIIVFHDHRKAFNNLKILLPRTLKYFSDLGYQFKKLPCDS